MNKGYLLVTLWLFASVLVSGGQKYWVGPLNGNWSNPAFWSAKMAGAGGAGVPGAQDSVLFNGDALVNIDMSPTINSL